MNWVLTGDIGIRLGAHLFTDFDYADDAVLLTESHDIFPTILQQMEDEASKFGLHVSWTKTTVQNIGSGTIGPPISMGSETVEPVESFCYLGSNVHSMSNSRDESIRRIGIASSALQRLSRIWKQRKLSIKTKFRLYICFILPILLYGSETWAMTNQDWRRLEAFHTKAQRRILGIKWSDFISNNEVYSKSGMETLHAMIRR